MVGAMIPAYPQWPAFPLPFPGRRNNQAPPLAGIADASAGSEIPDHHSQLEDLLGHVRRCERWAQLDDRIDLSLRLDGDR
jgi:hypothetical protein